MNKKKHVVTMVIIIVIIAGGMFYGGMKYGMSKTTTNRLAQKGANGMNAGAGRPAGGAGANGAGGFSNGQIIAKDDTSITIKTKDGGSKIVYYSASTTIGKTTTGTASDLSVGENVMVNGSSSTDGSIAAENIQIRPTDPQGPGAQNNQAN